MLGRWVRPWAGEALSGVVVAISGPDLICRTLDGLEFRVPLRDVKAWMISTSAPLPVSRRLTAVA